VNLARTLDPSMKNILIVAVEIPTTLIDVSGTTHDVWQGNCTFGDGAAALWIGTEPREGGLAIEDIRYRQRVDTGLDLIRWAYRDYYTFALADQKTFDENVREIVSQTLSESGERLEGRAALGDPPGRHHPAHEDRPQARHPHRGDPALDEPLSPLLQHEQRQRPAHPQGARGGHAPGAAINLVTMGAGFNVLYGRVRRVT